MKSSVQDQQRLARQYLPRQEWFARLTCNYSGLYGDGESFKNKRAGASVVPKVLLIIIDFIFEHILMVL